MPSAEKEKADKILADHGKNALTYYIGSPGGNSDEATILRYCKYFVSKGADVEAVNIAVGNNNLELVQFLVPKGADVNVKDSGETPLFRAVERDNLEVCKFLVSKGADVNAKDIGGWTPLGMAGNRQGIIDYLTSVGARHE